MAITEDELQTVPTKLNHYSRKTLGFQTPNQVCFVINILVARANRNQELKEESVMGYTMDDLKKKVDDLKQQRDEINLQLHLAKAEVRDEWDKLEPKWEEVKGKMATVSEVASQTAESVTATAGLLADEIKEGYERIKKAL